MANMIDYLAWRGDITFAERPFNEVDNLILAELAYAQLEDIVPGIGSEASVPLSEVARRYRALGRSQADLINDPGPVLDAAGASARFGEVRACAYVNRVEPQKQMQFAAVSFILPGGGLYVAYRGTDDSIVGWREDFNFGYTRTPGQAEAVRYINAVAKRVPGDLIVGGHSKGGNLAVYGAAFAEPEVIRRIRSIYTNDGPGFNRMIVNTSEYASVLGKVRLIIPESSLVGILLANRAERTIIKSSAWGVMQHDPNTWQVRGTQFEAAPALSRESQFMDAVLEKWLEGMDEAQIKNFVGAIFDSMDASGAQTLKEMKTNPESTGAVLKAIYKTDPERMKDAMNAIKRLGDTGWNLLLESASNRIAQWSKAAQEQTGGKA